MRSLDANFSSLEIFVENLTSKSFYIGCVETWGIKNVIFFKLEGYKMNHTEGDLSIADGIAVYVRNDVIENTEIIEAEYHQYQY